MRILPLILLFLAISLFNRPEDSPHGKDFRISCKTCHSTKGWYLDKSVYSFDHGKTGFPLTGQHASINCRQCHPTLVFGDAGNECMQCHTDIHQSTVGPDCSRCHTTVSWLVNNIIDIHRRSRFPLLGPHRTADCIRCHKSESLTRYDVSGIECIDCHRDNYLSTTNPDHVKSGISQDCAQCHPMTSFQWTGSGFNHSFFPLSQGHSAAKCSDCHSNGVYTGLSTACYSCHQADYNAATNPDHKSSNFPTTCENCHTLAPGWKPASFDHSKFPLTLGHSGVVCADCHKGSYSGTPADCFSCHATDYNNTTNPNHKTLAFSTTCTQCHTTNPGWKPATFTQHDALFPIYSGKHKGAWSTCVQCHPNPANYATFDCKKCHANAHVGQNYTNAQCYACHPRGEGGD